MYTQLADIYLLCSLIIPLIGALGAYVIRFGIVRDIFMVGISAAMLVNMWQIFKSGGVGISLTLWNITEVIPVYFSIEPIGLIFSMVISFLWLISTIYSIGYMRGNNEANQGRFYAFFALAIFGAVGVAFSGNLLTLFLFYEFLTICTFPLVAHHGSAEAKKAGRVYLGILMGTSVMLLLPAILITQHFAGTLDFVKGGILADKVSYEIAALLLFLFVFGIAKAAIMPVHKWLPAAMVAPTPVSALLHAVAVVKAGVFTIVKIIIYIFGTDYLQDMMDKGFIYGQWLLYFAAFTIIAASVIAYLQDNLKKRLAYSTVSQLSYVILAAAIIAPKSIIAAIFHIAAHAFGKITLFFAAGAIYTAAHKGNVSQLSGIGKKMPWTMVAFAVGAFSMIGVPPFAGFLTKWYMVFGTINQHLYPVIIVIILSTLLNAAYFLPIIYKAFFEEEKTNSGVVISHPHGEAPLLMVVALTITAFATIALFIWPDAVLNLAEEVAGQEISITPLEQGQ